MNGWKGRILAALCVLSCLALPAFGGTGSAEGLGQAAQLSTALRAVVPPGQSDRQLWGILTGEGNLQVRVGAGLVLADRLYPQGDLARWSEVQGWWLPEQIPLSLAAADAALVTAVLAAQLPDPSGSWLAFRLLDSFFASPDAWVFLGRCPPVAISDLEDSLSSRGIRSGRGWPPFGAAMGTLPLARPLFGELSLDQAMAQDLSFLDGMGRPTGGAGFYAWDRLTGRVYQIREKLRD